MRFVATAIAALTAGVVIGLSTFTPMIRSLTPYEREWLRGKRAPK